MQTIRLQGFVASIDAAKFFAAKRLKKRRDGEVLVIAFNGAELFIKRNNRLKVSSKQQWKKYISQDIINNG